MQLISKFGEGTRFSFCVIDVFSKYVWVVPLKDKKGITIVYSFQKVLNKPDCKPNKLWIDKESEFYNRSMKPWLEKNVIEMHSTHNEGKSVVAERCIRILKNKIYKHVTAVSKNVYIIKLDDMVNDYNNTYGKTIRTTPVDVKYNTYIDSIKEVNDKDRKFHVGDHVRKLKYENIFAKGYTPNWSEENIVTKKVKNTVPWTCMLLMISMVRKSLEHLWKRIAKNKSKRI